MMVVMVVMAADRLSTERLRQVLDVGELAARRGGIEIRRKLGELARRCRVAVRLGRLGGGLQVGGDLLRNLGVLGRV